MFLGRRDRQVKVRGYRVELDEIEGTLASHPALEEAAVYPVRVGDEIDHLEASATLKPGATAEPSALRDFVADVVSWYAVPKRIELPGSLPRTTSGKIDRRRLQAMAEEPATAVVSR